MVNSKHCPPDVRSKYLATVALAAFLIFMVAVCWFVGRPLVRFVSEPDKFRLWVAENGVKGRIAFLGMIVFQVIVAIVPGEPFEIGAGYAFGVVEGTLLCLAGAAIGSVAVFLLVRRFGGWVVEAFFPQKRNQKSAIFTEYAAAESDRFYRDVHSRYAEGLDFLFYRTYRYAPAHMDADRFLCSNPFRNYFYHRR